MLPAGANDDGELLQQADFNRLVVACLLIVIILFVAVKHWQWYRTYSKSRSNWTPRSEDLVSLLGDVGDYPAKPKKQQKQKLANTKGFSTKEAAISKPTPPSCQNDVSGDSDEVGVELEQVGQALASTPDKDASQSHQAATNKKREKKSKRVNPAGGTGDCTAAAEAQEVVAHDASEQETTDVKHLMPLWEPSSSEAARPSTSPDGQEDVAEKPAVAKKLSPPHQHLTPKNPEEARPSLIWLKNVSETSHATPATHDLPPPSRNALPKPAADHDHQDSSLEPSSMPPAHSSPSSASRHPAKIKATEPPSQPVTRDSAQATSATTRKPTGAARAPQQSQTQRLQPGSTRGTSRARAVACKGASQQSEGTAEDSGAVPQDAGKEAQAPVSREKGGAVPSAPESLAAVAPAPPAAKPAGKALSKPAARPAGKAVTEASPSPGPGTAAATPGQPPAIQGATAPSSLPSAEATAVAGSSGKTTKQESASRSAKSKATCKGEGSSQEARDVAAAGPVLHAKPVPESATVPSVDPKVAADPKVVCTKGPVVNGGSHDVSGDASMAEAKVPTDTKPKHGTPEAKAAKARAEAKAEPQAKSAAESKAEVAKPDAETREAKAEAAKAEAAKAEAAKAEVKADSKPDSKADSKAEAKAEAKPEAKEAKPEAKPEAAKKRSSNSAASKREQEGPRTRKGDAKPEAAAPLAPSPPGLSPANSGIAAAQVARPEASAKQPVSPKVPSAKAPQGDSAAARSNVEGVPGYNATALPKSEALKGAKDLSPPAPPPGIEAPASKATEAPAASPAASPVLAPTSPKPTTAAERAGARQAPKEAGKLAGKPAGKQIPADLVLPPAKSPLFKSPAASPLLELASPAPGLPLPDEIKALVEAASSCAPSSPALVSAVALDLAARQEQPSRGGLHDPSLLAMQQSLQVVDIPIGPDGVPEPPPGIWEDGLGGSQLSAPEEARGESEPEDESNLQPPLDGLAAAATAATAGPVAVPAVLPAAVASPRVEQQASKAEPASNQGEPVSVGRYRQGRQGRQTRGQREREQLVRDLFHALDSNHDGLVEGSDLKQFAKLTGFDGTDLEWEQEYVLLCQEWDCEGRGLSEDTFEAMLNDKSERGCFCSDEDLKDVLRKVRKRSAGEQSTAAKESKADRAKGKAQVPGKHEETAGSELPQSLSPDLESAIAATWTPYSSKIQLLLDEQAGPSPSAEPPVPTKLLQEQGFRPLPRPIGAEVKASRPIGAEVQASRTASRACYEGTAAEVPVLDALQQLREKASRSANATLQFDDASLTCSSVEAPLPSQERQVEEAPLRFRLLAQVLSEELTEFEAAELLLHHGQEPPHAKELEMVRCQLQDRRTVVMQRNLGTGEHMKQQFSGDLPVEVPRGAKYIVVPGETLDQQHRSTVGNVGSDANPLRSNSQKRKGPSK